MKISDETLNRVIREDLELQIESVVEELKEAGGALRYALKKDLSALRRVLELYS